MRRRPRPSRDIISYILKWPARPWELWCGRGYWRKSLTLTQADTPGLRSGDRLSDWRCSFVVKGRAPQTKLKKPFQGFDRGLVLGICYSVAADSEAVL
jgi:hypothetical protein